MSLKPNISFTFSLFAEPGVVAANNYMSLFNPVGSGKKISVAGIFVSGATTGATTSASPLGVIRITSATGGTLQPASEIAKFNTSFPDPVGEVRTGNPTCTLAQRMFSSPPPSSQGVDSTPTHQAIIPGAIGPFLLAPGQGFVLRTASGDINQVWNLSAAWVEF